MKAVILAGGQDTHLVPLVRTVPKPLLPVANRPMVEYVLGLLKGPFSPGAAPSAGSNGKKDEYGPLADDFSALIRIRRDLSTYVQQAAASVETRGKLPYAAASSPAATTSQLPKKIIVDDTVPEKKPAKKKPEMLSNIE